MPLRKSFLALGLLTCTFAQADFQIEDTGKALNVTENGAPVLTYHYGWVLPPEGVEHRFYRTGYIHPLHGPGGEILTQDFPDDHYHHRGVFWGWPNTTWKGQRVDTWGLDGARQATVSCVPGAVTGEHAAFSGENFWVLDGAYDYPIASERYEIVVHAATDSGRAIDFTITLENISDAPIVMRGATTDGKGYGGFNFRPDKARKPMHFTTALGAQTEDAFEVASPWVDVSFAVDPGSETLSGAAIFQHPDNPAYPHHGWLLRHYAFLGHAWPGNTEHTVEPGAEVTLKYRLYTHRGNAETGQVAEAFDDYLKEAARSNGNVEAE